MLFFKSVYQDSFNENESKVDMLDQTPLKMRLMLFKYGAKIYQKEPSSKETTDFFIVQSLKERIKCWL